VLAALPELQVISSFGVGLDKLPLAQAAERGIAVGYTPDVLNDCVADLAFALLLDVARRVSESDRFVRRGDWLRGNFPLSRKVSGARLGIVGMGRIGRTIAQRSTGFEMQVRYHSRRPAADVAWAHEPDLVALAGWADYLVVITAGGPETRHLVNAQVIQALGPDGMLINVARGSVVDEQALIEALQQGRLGGAGLDVFADEPNVPAALIASERVVLSPHTASGTRETRQAMADRVSDNLDAWFSQGRVLSAAPVK
jgi:lactate dehydrogenase-like 2-hydroxyacid dehydrogenase